MAYPQHRGDALKRGQRSPVSLTDIYFASPLEMTRHSLARPVGSL